MSTKRSKRHHIVPETMQKAFLGQNGKLWYSERDADGRFSEPEPRTPYGAFWKPHHNTIMVQGKPSDVVEKKHYGALDDFVGRLFPDLNKILAKGNVPRMESSLADTLKLVVYEMLRRTPDFAKFDDEEIGAEFVDSLIKGYRENGEFDQQLKEAISDRKSPSRLRAYGRNIRTRGMFMMPDRSEKEILKRKIRWVIAPEKCSYVLSSSIVPRTGNGGSNGMANPNSELWMPISPKHCLVLVSDPTNSIPHICYDDRDHIRDFNEYACSNSEAIGSHSEKLVRSLTGW